MNPWINALVENIRTNARYIAHRIEQGEAAGYVTEQTQHMQSQVVGKIHALEIIGYEPLAEAITDEVSKMYRDAHAAADAKISA